MGLVPWNKVYEVLKVMPDQPRMKKCTSPYCNVRPRVPWLWDTGGHCGAYLKSSWLLRFPTDSPEGHSILSAETRLAKQEAPPGAQRASEQHNKYSVTVSSAWNQSHCLSHLLNHVPIPVIPPETLLNNHRRTKTWRPLKIWLEVPVLTDFLLCFGPFTPLLPTAPNTLRSISHYLTGMSGMPLVMKGIWQNKIALCCRTLTHAAWHN